MRMITVRICIGKINLFLPWVIAWLQARTRRRPWVLTSIKDLRDSKGEDKTVY